MRNIFFPALFLCAVLTSCQDDDVPTPTPPANVAYMSLSAGSTWNYELVDNVAASTSPFTLTSTNNGKAYHVFTNSSGSANEYYNITGSEYFNFRSLPSILGVGNVENIYLKDNVAAGASWTQSYPITVSGVAMTFKLTNTITEKGISKTVNGTAYSDVIRVTTAMDVTIGVLPLPPGALTTDIQSFYAPKFGLIQSKNKIDINFSGIVEHTDQQTNLKTADIK